MKTKNRSDHECRVHITRVEDSISAAFSTPLVFAQLVIVTPVFGS